jgi:hypothetical protein
MNPRIPVVCPPDTPPCTIQMYRNVPAVGNMMGPRVNGALSIALLAAKAGLKTELTVWPEPTQVQVTVPATKSETVSGEKALSRTSTVAAATGGPGGGGGGGGGGGLTVVEEPPQAKSSAAAKRLDPRAIRLPAMDDLNVLEDDFGRRGPQAMSSEGRGSDSAPLA